MTSQLPISDHAILGDTRTAALVTSAGEIDWMCVPRFDGPPVFGRLIGGALGGSFTMGPSTPAAVLGRGYQHSSPVLSTTWSVGQATLTLTEGMIAEQDKRLLPTTLLVRRLSARGATVPVQICFDPRYGYDHAEPGTRRDGSRLICSFGSLALGISSSPQLDLEPGRPKAIQVEPGRDVIVVMSIADREPVVWIDPESAWDALMADARGWDEWSNDIDADLPYREAVVRSLVTLRLLTYSPSGAPVAAPTTSLPELVGGSRNWDYRFAWPRDASIGIGAFLGVGMADEARHFLAWLLHASRLDRPRMPVLFTLDGRHPARERTLDRWPGYRDSPPVRVGNGAVDQHQLDGYGWVLDGAWLLVASGHRLWSETWRAMRGFADHVAQCWRLPDAGIWEIRGDQAHHVHSKAMAWLALDRAIAIAGSHRTRPKQLRRWQTERDSIAEEVHSRGFSSQRGAYTRTYGSDDFDSAMLVLPLIGLDPIDSPRVTGTIDAIWRSLSAGGPLLYRYPPGTDGLSGSEGAFLPCSFWLVQALARTGRRAEAVDLFEQLVELGGPLGLYPEEVDPLSGEFVGNYPQALTHAALVQAALALRDGSTCNR